MNFGHIYPTSQSFILFPNAPLQNNPNVESAPLAQARWLAFFILPPNPHPLQTYFTYGQDPNNKIIPDPQPRALGHLICILLSYYLYFKRISR